MSQQPHPSFTTYCAICTGRSAWDFLQDFYFRVETAEICVQRLEKDLYDAQTTARQYHNTLAQYEASLSTSWDILNEERLAHQKLQEALMFESGRQKEKIAFLERLLRESMSTSEAVENLCYQRNAATTVCQATPRIEGCLTGTALAEENLVGNDTTTSVGRLSRSSSGAEVTESTKGEKGEEKSMRESPSKRIRFPG